MTISSQVRKAGPFLGTGAVVDYPFAFKVFSAADLLVVKADANGAESTLVLNSDYTVTLNADQDASPGGKVTLTTPLPANYLLVITSDIDALQPTDLTNQGGFYPAVVNASLDRLTILIQQLSEKVGRSAKLPITRTEDIDALVSDIVVLADNLSSVNTVAGISANVTTVAGISANVTTVANNTANINAAVADLPSLAAKVSKTGDTMTGNLNVPSINGGQLAGMRNKAINGKMGIAQRGTSFSAIASGSYSLDRWVYGASGDAVLTISQQTDAPSSNEFLSSLRATVTTNDTTLAAGDHAGIIQRIEGYNARDLIGKTFTLSFWVRSSKTGIHCVAFRNGGADRSYVAEYTISAANTWEFKTITVSGGLITAGTWDWTTGIGLDVRWALAAGSGLQTTAGAWQTGSFIATANQVNCLDAVDNIFAITGVQLEVGEKATPFEHRPYGTELALCQRYYCITGASATGYASAAGTSTIATHVYWPVTMRDTPTTTNAGGTVTNASAAGLDQVSQHGARFHISPAGVGVSSVAGRGITASAEL